MVRVKTDAKRQEILKAAGCEFAKRGFHNTTIADIAANIGASKATIYNYFSSKSELFWEMLAEAAGPVMIDIVARLDGDAPFSPRLRSFCHEYLRLFTSSWTIGVQRLMIAEVGNSDVASRLRSRTGDSGWRQVTALLEQAQQAGHLREGDVTMMAAHLRALLEGGLPFHLLFGDKVDHSPEQIRRTANAVADFFLQACASV